MAGPLNSCVELSDAIREGGRMPIFTGKDPMFERLNQSNSQDEALVEELQRNTTANIRHEREYERFAVTASVEALPANLSAGDHARAGRTVDLSAGGCMGVFEVPLQVGDVYRIRLSGGQALPEFFARCLRVRMLRDRAFEAGFAFLSPVDLDLLDGLTEVPHARAG